MKTKNYNCFMAGAKVSVDFDEVKNIEDIRVGDKLLSHDRKHGSEVLEIHVYDINDTILMYDYSDFKVTGDHPLWLEGAEEGSALTWIKSEDSIHITGKDVHVDKLYNIKTSNHFFVGGVGAHGDSIINRNED